MKKALVLITLSLFTISIFAQNNSDDKKDENVAFAEIERVPIYPGCDKNDSNIVLKKCMSGKITEHVSQNFNTKRATENVNLSGIQTIYCQFKVNKKGDVTDIKIRAPHKKLEKETLRVLKSIPRMIPGQQRGEVVNVLYALPIKFKIEGTTKETAKEKRKRIRAEKRAKKNN